MATTSNLGITHLTVSQVGKETSINTALDRLDVSNNDTVDFVTTAGGTLTLSETDRLDNILIRFTGSPAGAYNIDIPDGNRALHFENASGQTATIDTVGGSVITLALADNETVAIDVRSAELTIVGAVGDGTGVATGVISYGKQTEILPVESWFDGAHGSSNTPAALEALQGAANGPGVQGRAFDSTTEEFLLHKFALPSRWNKGTVTFSTVYYHKGGQTGGLDGVAFTLRAVQIADGAAHAGTFGTAQASVLDPGVAANALWNTAESSAITVGGTLADGLPILWAVSRDPGNGSDDLNVDAFLVEVHLHWTEDAPVDD